MSGGDWGIAHTEDPSCDDFLQWFIKSLKDTPWEKATKIEVIAYAAQPTQQAANKDAREAVTVHNFESKAHRDAALKLLHSYGGCVNCNYKDLPLIFKMTKLNRIYGRFCQKNGLDSVTGA